MAYATNENDDMVHLKHLVDIVPVKDLPEVLRACVRQIGGGSSRKKKAIVTISSSTTIGSSQWSGGTRESYAIAEIGTPGGSHAIVNIGNINDARSWPDNMGALADRYEIPANSVVLVGGTFCGKPATPKLTLNAELAAELGLVL